jgi:hypothetical protein
MHGSTVQGVGLGLRSEFLNELVERTDAAETEGRPRLPIDFLEITPENYVGRGGGHPAALAWLAERYPLVTHGLTLSVGGCSPLDRTYLQTLSSALHAWATPWHSDHLCFSAVGGRMIHELLPIAHTRRNVERVADRIRQSRDAIGLPFLVENISYYWHPGRADMSEAEFLSALCARADCGLLLDVNNVQVNAMNFGFDAEAWLDTVPLGRVRQLHVAGHERFAIRGQQLVPCDSDAGMVIDTHGAVTPPSVLGLLEKVLEQVGPVPVTLERDNHVPSLDELLEELGRIRVLWHQSAERVSRAE